MNENWRHSAIEVTKYNPIFRDKNGYYTKEEWVSYGDIGKLYDGELFTLAMYEETERKYIEVAKTFFKYFGCENIRINALEKPTLSYANFSDDFFLNFEEAKTLYDKIESENVLLLKDIDIVVHLVLREYLWCELLCEGLEDIAVRFGYDYYMFLNCPLADDKLLNGIKRLGLYVRC